MRVVGYVRVSTEEQAKGGTTIHSHPEKIRAYASLHGHDLAELIVENEAPPDAGEARLRKDLRKASAKSLDRQGVRRALAMLDAGAAGGLVVVKLDRLTRSLKDWVWLQDRYFGEKAGKALMSLSEMIDTSTAMGRAMLAFGIIFAQLERETTAERTKAALAFKRSRGERISRRIPYGKELADDGKTLRHVEVEQARLRTIREMRARGASPRQIAATLNAREIPAKNGGAWNESSVRSICARLKAEVTDG